MICTTQGVHPQSQTTGGRGHRHTTYALGCDVQQLHGRFPLVQLAHDRTPLLIREFTGQEVRVDVDGQEGVDLILHEGEEGADHDGEAPAEHCGELVAQAFPAASWHEHERVLATERRLHDGCRG